MRKLLKFTLPIAILLMLSPHAAALSLATVVLWLDHTTEDMKKWQKAQKWGKYRSARYGRAVFIGNLTNDDITFTFEPENENCDVERATLAPLETIRIMCPDGGGNAFFNIFFLGYTATVDEGTRSAFAITTAGGIGLFYDSELKETFGIK